MKIVKLILAVLLLGSAFANLIYGAGQITGVRFNTYPEKIRIVFDLDQRLDYEITTHEAGLVLDLGEAQIDDEVPIKINDEALPEIRFTRVDGRLKIGFPYKKPLKYRIFPLAEPNRVVVDLLRIEGEEIPAASGDISTEAFAEAAAENSSEVTTEDSATAVSTAESIPVPPKIVFSQLTQVADSSAFNKVRVVFNFAEVVSFEATATEGGLKLSFINTKLGGGVKDKIELEDKITNNLTLKAVGNNVEADIVLHYNVPHKIFELFEPYRVVVDFQRLFDEKNVVQVEEGVEQIYLRRGLKNGPVIIHALKIDPKKAEIEPYISRPPDKKNRNFYKEKVSEAAGKTGALAAINGIYFSSTGRPLGLLMIDRKLYSSPIFDRSALIIDKDQNLYIDRVGLDARIKLKGGDEFPINGINRQRSSEEFVLFTEEFGEESDTNEHGVDVSIKDGKIVKIELQNAKIPKGGMVVSAHGPAGNVFYNTAKIGEPVEIIQELKFYEAKLDVSRLKHIMAGGPRLVKNGYISINSDEEQIQKDVAQGRAARTAAGITEDNQLLMVVVEGLMRTNGDGNGKMSDSNYSTGMSLEELAQVMFDLGARDAVNFDGGGSSALVVKDQLINRPVRGEEVKVGNTLLVKKKKMFFWF